MEEGPTMIFIKHEVMNGPGIGSHYDLYQTGCDEPTWNRVTLLTVTKQGVLH